jgi:2'-5' RNA ligase
MIRLFVAVRMPKPIQDAVNRTVGELRRLPDMPKDAKWVRSDSLHATLKFIGEINEEKVAELRASLFKAFEGQKSFSIEFKGIGAFPDVRRPRVLWAGIVDAEKALENLARRVDECTVEAGFAKTDKEFTPHLTLCRFVNLPSGRFANGVSRHENESFGSMTVDRVFLIRSQMGQHGSEYHDFHEFDLA